MIDQTALRSDFALLQKMQSMGLRSAEDLERLAVARGCLYYSDFTTGVQTSTACICRELFSNEELIVALLNPVISGKLLHQRLAAAMLGAPELRAEILVALAKAEKCDGMLKYLAACGQDVEPEVPFWATLLSELQASVVPEIVPHPTRMIEMTGITRGRIGIQKRWIRPVPLLALAP